MTAAFLWALAATAVSWVVIGIAASLAGGVGASDPWIYFETMSAYAAAAAVGTLVGNHVKGVTSVAVAAGIVLAAAMVLGGQGIKAFQVAYSSGTMIGLERTPARAALAIALNLSIALLCIGVAGLTSGVRRPSRFALGALAIPLVASLSSPWRCPSGTASTVRAGKPRRASAVRRWCAGRRGPRTCCGGRNAIWQRPA